MVRPGRPRGDDAERDGEQRRDGGRDTAAPQPRDEAGLTERHAHARRKHQHRESDLRQERNRRLRRVEPAETADPDHNAGGELADDHRHERPLPRREQRPGQPRQDDHRENAEAHRPIVLFADGPGGSVCSPGPPGACCSAHG
jgi:hypothetical protein